MTNRTDCDHVRPWPVTSLLLIFGETPLLLLTAWFFLGVFTAAPGVHPGVLLIAMLAYTVRTLELIVWAVHPYCGCALTASAVR
jgi:hypothetical protein